MMLPLQVDQDEEEGPNCSSTVTTATTTPPDNLNHPTGKMTAVQETTTMMNPIDSNKMTCRHEPQKNKKKEQMKTASIRETLAFVYNNDDADINHKNSSCHLQMIFVTGVLGAILSGLIYPAMAWIFADSLSTLSGTASSSSLDSLAQMAFNFLIIGVFALIFGLMQGWCFEILAHAAANNFRHEWFKALLRQDAAFFDIYDVGALAGQIGPNALKYQRGMGRKLGEGIQFLTTAIGGLIFAFYSSWRVALVILIVFPVVAAGTMATQYYNVTASQRAAQHYQRAGGISYSAVSAIKTVLSLNAIPEMIRQYNQATRDAFQHATFFLIKKGLANASFTASFLTLYTILTLYGSSLLYKEVAQVGCDPSASVLDNVTCGDSAPQVFAAMMGVAFAAQGVANFGNCLGMIEDARVAAYQALQAINRKPGADSEIIYNEINDNDKDECQHDSEFEDGVEDRLSPRRFSRRGRNRRSSTSKEGPRESNRNRRKSRIMSFDMEQVLSGENDRKVKGILPRYEIDSTSRSGAKPTNVHGAISIKDVHFSYPTRPNVQVFKGISTDIKAGSTVAFVGPSGGGKSTVVSLLERFYDPQSGSIELDGINLKDWNVKHLRSLIGFVGQEPTLFATTIRQNIQYGNPKATKEEIEEAARLANAHDFISSFSDGYDTQVGDKGSQLSGGQKQRIAIARILVGNPKVLLLDEATSALDAESELVVQEALDNIIAHKNITTIIVAHRLSTIRHADKINVIVDGRLAESGTHNELMETASYYRKMVEKQEGVDDEELNNSSGSPSRQSSSLDLAKLDEQDELETDNGVAHVAFKNVSFAYPTRPRKMVLEKFNLRIKAGQTVAIVGESGGGKSTTANLLERFYDPLEGSIEYFGVDVKTLNVSWYRDQLGYVGQEPTLFDDTIARNIAYGAPGVSQAEVEDVCRQANAHDYIVEFPEGYDTPVGQRGTQLSGGQKQRVAIARALARRPKLLILDEATSALDNESEAIVQAAINNVMASRDHTVIVIAHRLSTIRNADFIAFIRHGRVTEFGSHDELLRMPHGRYRRLFESSKLKASVANVGLRKGKKENKVKDTDEEIIDWEKETEKEAAKSFDLKRARRMARPDLFFLLAGAMGALMSGGVYPLWGVLFSQMIGLLFRRVEACPSADGTIPSEFDTCEDYWLVLADDMQQRSFEVAWHWATLVAASIFGTVLSVWSFGMASERLNKRVRDASFEALLRQEISYFDKRSVGSLTSQLEDDAARIHLFTGEPIRQACIALASVVIGVLLSFILMWPFALLAIATLPLMMFAVSQRMKTHFGSDQGVYVADELNSPGGIIVETLLNIRTVSALTLEQQRFDDFKRASRALDEGHRMRCFTEGIAGALGMFVRQWTTALQLWFGGYLMFTFPNEYSFQDFLISNFAIMFSLFGLATAFQDMADQKVIRESAGRIFALVDRQSAIDPLSSEGKVL